MKFSNYVSVYDIEKRNHKTGGLCNPMSSIEYYRMALEKTSGIKNIERMPIDSTFGQTRVVVVTEARWFSYCRPYYKLFPSIIDCFLRLKLDVRLSDLSIPEKTIVIRMADGQPLNTSESEITTILVDVNKHNTSGSSYIAILFQKTNKRTATVVFFLETDKTLEEILQEKQRDRFTEEVETVFRIAFTTLLLFNDPSIIQPDVLAADRHRFDNSTDPELRQRLIDKAKRRGVVGWRIGEQYETIPHYRRPHPALYHVGKGRKEQRIVFRAGSIVHRQKLTEVPTGWIDEDGREIER